MDDKAIFEKCHNFFKNQAFTTKNSKGRLRKKLDPDMADFTDYMNPWEIDFSAILESKALRRLDHKTQVFTSPYNSHVRTRRSHTDEVVALSIKISEILGLNINLCRAIAICHDIGHTPFGHLGEKVISELSQKEFNHGVFSIVIAQEIERKGLGLNLTYETLEGVLHHSAGDNKDIKTNKDLPLEYAIVKYADKISYTFADASDLQRFELDHNSYELERILSLFGSSQRERVRRCILALLEESVEKKFIDFCESKTAKNFLKLRVWMYENIYKKLNRKIYQDALYSLFEILSNLKNEIVLDPLIFMALMTDKEVIEVTKLSLSKPKIIMEDLKNISIVEILPNISFKKIDFTNPGLNW